MEADIVLIVCGTKLPAQKSLLCQHSPYFLAMFQDHFAEENKSEIELHSVDPTVMEMLINWTNCTSLPHKQLSTQEVMDLLQCAGMLQFAEVQGLCVEILCSRLATDNCWSLMQFADLVSEQKLLSRAKKYILWNFERTLTSSDYKNVDATQLREILKSEHLNVKDEMVVFQALLMWIGKENKKDKLLPQLFWDCVNLNSLSEGNMKTITEHDLLKSEHKLFKIMDSKRKLGLVISNRVGRCPPTYPCIVGHMSTKEPNKDEKRTEEDELDDWNQMGVRASRYQDTCREKDKTVHMFVFDPDTCQVESLGPVTNVQDGEVEASGFKVMGSGVDLVLSGGEFSLGHSNWSKNVTTWSSFKRRWEHVTTMDSVRRHHTMVIMGRVVYLLGGFGKHRIILDSMDSIDLDTGDQRQCASLPVAIYRPAAAQFKGRIFVVGKKMVMVYHPFPQNHWATHNQMELPPDVEFDSAMASDTHIYLTSAHSRDLYRFDPECKGQDLKLDIVGQFSKEANNTCIVNGIIYNFHSEEFDDERVVESFDTKTEEFKVLWKKDVPEWDFSPFYCLGCFPIVDYK